MLTILKPIVVLSLTLIITTIAIFFYNPTLPDPNYLNPPNPNPMSSSSSTLARTFILWLHGLGDSGPANEPIKTMFRSPEFRNAVWSFPSAPNNPVSCNRGMVMPSWFDIHEIPITADSPKDMNSLLKAVKHVHSMIDMEVTAGTNPKNIFVCGFSQGGALTLASVLLYPGTLGGGAIFSGWVPFNSSIVDQISPEAKKTPLLWSHGIADQTVLFEAGQAGPPYLEKLGISCEFKAYPGLGHSISNQELQHLEAWIKSRLQASSS
uniref:Phospholipase/carboxylesterase/thioesterase domain-containing protein n=1 Tax=Kalanchoe fedtschenkoi TaxID=63787 RepID=A0A7N0UIX5_KALFE